MTDQGCAPCANPCGVVTLIQGYSKVYTLALFYADTKKPFDLTGATQIKVFHPGVSQNQAPVIETLAVVLTTTGDTTAAPDAASNQLKNLASVAGIKPGLSVSGAGIPAGTFVESVSGSNVTMSQQATATATGVNVTFGNTNVVVLGAPGAGQIQVTVPLADSAAVAVNPAPTQNQDIQVSVTNADTSVTAFLLQAALNVVAPPYGVA